MSAPDSETLEAELAAVREELRKTQEQLVSARHGETRLRAELQHRVRNMLAVVRSIFNRTISTGASVQEIADHFSGRLDTVIRYQSFHALDRDEMVDVEMMVRDELQSFRFGDQPLITIKGDEVRLGRDVAQLIALAIHELVTNSLKFGALSGSSDRAHLDIGWAAADGSLNFEWIEAGVAVISSAPLRQGFGREYIEQALPYQLGGSASFELRPGGLICVMTIPLDAKASPMI